MNDAESDKLEEQASSVTSKFLGDYICSFQWIENRLDQIIHLSLGNKYWFFTKIVLAEMSNASKVRSVRALVNNALLNTQDKSQKEWLLHFNSVMKRVTAEAETRNQLVHGQYDYTGTKHGLPVMMFYGRVGKEGITDKSRPMSEEVRKRHLVMLMKLCADLGAIHKQLTHWAPKIFEDASKRFMKNAEVVESD
ncbi:hypothetical protein [Kordiimonas sp.]|uniref:hypothetical protein n=1 Tax=Kordiimonas sp. TaxID=1970157 RepID=UPI003A8F6CDB